MTDPTPQWAAIVKPGDTLVLSYAQRLNLAEVDELHARLALWLDPLDVKALIVTGASGMSVVRPDEDVPSARTSSPQTAETSPEVVPPRVGTSEAAESAYRDLVTGRSTVLIGHRDPEEQP